MADHTKDLVEKSAGMRKSRKPYPSREERLKNVEAKIERLTKLNEGRAKLIAKTEETLNERKAAYAKSDAQLKKALARRESLLAAQNRPAKPENAQNGKGAERKQIQELLAAVKAKGITLDDLLAKLG